MAYNLKERFSHQQKHKWKKSCVER